MWRLGRTIVLALSVYFAMGVSSWADMLVLKDGKVIEGDFVAGNEANIQFRSKGAGTIESYPLNQITTITLSPRPEASAGGAIAVPVAGAGVVAATAVPGTSPDVVTLPAGTKLMINFPKAVSTASHPKGSSFQVVLEQDLAVEGKMVAPKGTPVYGQVVDARGGKKLGAQFLKLTLTGLSVHNQKVPIVTEGFGVEGGAGGTAKTVGAAALVGAAIDGGEGAAKGAAVGGAISLLAPGSHVQFPAGTILEVPLKEAVAVIP
jgi:hypothetical protein